MTPAVVRKVCTTEISFFGLVSKIRDLVCVKESIALQSQTPKVRQWQKNEHTHYKIVSSESSCINCNFSVASFVALTLFQSLFLYTKCRTYGPGKWLAVRVGGKPRTPLFVNSRKCCALNNGKVIYVKPISSLC